MAVRLGLSARKTHAVPAGLNQDGATPDGPAMARPWRDRNRDISRLTTALLRLTDLAVLVVDRDLEVQWASEGAKHLLPATAGLLPSLVDPEYAPILASLIDRAVRAGGQAVQAVCAVPVEGTGPRRLELVARDLRQDPDVAGITVTMLDVTGWVERETSYRAHLHLDPLTGLGNRASLLEDLVRAVSASEATGPRAAVLMVDIDSFKHVNDRYGHEFGDRLLRAVGARLTEVVGGRGSVYRLGGDEFVVLLDKASEDEAVALAEAAVRAVALPIALPERPPELSPTGPDEEQRVSVSIGVAMFDAARGTGVAPGQAANAMLRDADTAMYRCKAAGRSRAELFRPELRDWALMRKADAETLANQVQQLKDENRALAEAATTDPRTGLANTAMFDADHEQMYARLARSGEPYSVLLVDIDHFHDYNTAYGYLRGNDALARVAAALASAVRQGDRAYRYGGEEFTALLPGTHLEGARAVAERVRLDVEALGLEHPTNPGGNVTVTIGVLEALQRHAKVTEVFESVNALLLKGKDAGRNRVIAPEEEP